MNYLCTLSYLKRWMLLYKIRLLYSFTLLFPLKEIGNTLFYKFKYPQIIKFNNFMERLKGNRIYNTLVFLLWMMYYDFENILKVLRDYGTSLIMQKKKCLLKYVQNVFHECKCKFYTRGDTTLTQWNLRLFSESFSRNAKWLENFSMYIN